ncbi:MAG: hypothetical protein NXI04_26310 [Planctomycetaceae bacterium]|nr:hypothetical protein [Planctomycetaceae bacterium]
MPSEKKTSGFSLKDELFNKERVTWLAGLFQTADPEFPAPLLIRRIMKTLPQLELKQRIVLIAEQLERVLPDDFGEAAAAITAALPPPLDPTLTDDDFGDFIFAPLGEFVVRNGLTKQHLRTSLKTLKALTQRFSMEDAIRAFLNEFPEQTLKELDKWSRDRNYHVRRLVSEGTRPVLPWSKRISLEPDVPIPLLDQLHADPTRYVTRSVANHLNDIARTDPSLVLKTLKRWQKAGLQDPKELDWLTRHALRGLVKKGDRDALKLLGFRADPKIRIAGLSMKSTKLVPGEAVDFSFELTAERKERLLVDYVIHFVKANGTLAPKVHKLKQVDLAKGETVTLGKRHTLRANATTYTLYPGEHKLSLQINGRPYGEVTFQLGTAK